MEEYELTIGFNDIDGSMNDEDSSGLEKARTKPWKWVWRTNAIGGFGLPKIDQSDSSIDSDEYYAKHPKKQNARQ